MKKNKKIAVSIVVIIITIVFIYYMAIISQNNKCSGVRSFNIECRK